MSYKQIVAIVRQSKIKALTNKLYEHNIPGASIIPIQGYGEFVKTYSKNILEDSVRIEIFALDKDATKIAALIMRTAYTGLEGDGLVAVLPVEGVYHTRQLMEMAG